MEKVIVKIFDRKTSSEKKPHVCNVCAVYKREIAKGNREAFEFYKAHIAEIARQNQGVTFVMYGKPTVSMLTSAKKGKFKR